MRELKIQARLYILLVIILGFILITLYSLQLEWQNPWLFILAGLASVAQILKVEGSTSQSSYNIAWFVFGFTFVFLGIPSTLFVIVVAHLVEWLWHKYLWYIQLFNIGTFACTLALSGLVFETINPSLENFSLQGSLGLIGGLVVFTILNHLMVGIVLWLARNLNFKESGIFGGMTLSIDFTMISLGAASGLIYLINPAATFLTIIPLQLLYNTLKVPALERLAEIDSKTRIFNAAFFNDAISKELSRANRFDRPLTVVMGDLDHLRNVNNTYGHLAGDVVLQGIASILQENFRGYDVVARFGGEEFAILLPETNPEQAYPRVEEVRQIIAKTGFSVSTNPEPIYVTMSFGVNGRVNHNQTVEELLHNSDIALYHSKENGRNRVSIFSPTGMKTIVAAPNKIEALKLRSQEIELKEPVSGSVNVTAKADLDDRIIEKFDTQKPQKMVPASEIAQPLHFQKPRPTWMLNTYIGGIAIAGLILMLIHTGRGYHPIDWLGLGLILVVTFLTEFLSIDIYGKDASVSTSAAPYIAGVILFSHFGAILLSLTLAVTAFFKRGRSLGRFIFNFGNHLIGSLFLVSVLEWINPNLLDANYFDEIIIALAAAVWIYFSSTFGLAGALSLSSDRKILDVWREQFRWLFSYYVAFGIIAFTLILGYQNAYTLGVIAMLVPVWMLRFSQVQYLDNTRSMVTQLRNYNAELEKQRNENVRLSEELLFSLAQTIDLRDPYTHNHSRQVAQYCIWIAEKLGLKKERIELIRKAGLLHDIGKLGIPEAILFKPGKLTTDEYEKVKEHTVLGLNIVKPIHSLQNVLPAIYHHHERFDGKGYPEGLQGHIIPLEARIVGLADAVEAMASDRPYRKGLSYREIHEEIKNNSGTQFDPEIVNAFLRVLEERGDEIIVNATLFENEAVSVL